MQGEVSLVVRVAHDLLAFACDAGAPALASFVLPTASMGCASAEALVAALEGREESSGSTLLHRALRSKSTAMVEGLLAWGTHTSYQWQVRFSGSLSLHAHCNAHGAYVNLAGRGQTLLSCVCGPTSMLAYRLLSL